MLKRLSILSLALLLLLSLAACGEDAAEKPKDKPDDTTQTADPIQDTPTEDPAEKQKGITGSHATDIKLSLEQRGLPNNPLGATNEFGTRFTSSSYTDPSTGITLDYAMVTDTDYQIISVTFGVDKGSAGLNNEQLFAIAAPYLSFCGSLPYDAADPEAAQAWIKEKLPLVTREASQTTTIGDADFELYVGETDGVYVSCMLQVSKVIEE